jgi:hypothetical protein
MDYCLNRNFSLVDLFFRGVQEGFAVFGILELPQFYSFFNSRNSGSDQYGRPGGLFTYTPAGLRRGPVSVAIPGAV